MGVADAFGDGVGAVFAVMVGVLDGRPPGPITVKLELEGTLPRYCRRNWKWYGPGLAVVGIVAGRLNRRSPGPAVRFARFIDGVTTCPEGPMTSQTRVTVTLSCDVLRTDTSYPIGSPGEKLDLIAPPAPSMPLFVRTPRT
jgi:hypothetical protein